LSKFKTCLTNRAKQDNGSIGGWCYEYVDRILADCKKESEGCGE